MANSIKTSMFVGAVAGTTPLLVNLVGVDANLIIDNFELGILVGYLIKAVGLMLLGAFVVFVNSEVDLKKAFQLGIMAPAFVIGAINANNFSDARNEINQLEKELGGPPANGQTDAGPARIFPEHQFSFSLLSAAHADGTLIGEHNQPPGTSKYMWYGITGSISDAWFVIVASYKNEVDAKQQATALLAKNYDARVYQPFSNNKNYAVVIGSYMSLSNARNLKEQAIKDGLPRETYLWKWKP